MTKKAFMRQLRFALRGGLRRAVRTNILAFFTQGQAKHLHETDITAELSELAVIALNLAREAGKQMLFCVFLFQNEQQIRFILSAILYITAALFNHTISRK